MPCEQEILQDLDELYGFHKDDFSYKAKEQITDYADYENETTAAGNKIIVFEPLVEYGNTEVFIYWVEMRPVILDDL